MSCFFLLSSPQYLSNGSQIPQAAWSWNRNSSRNRSGAHGNGRAQRIGGRSYCFIAVPSKKLVHVP